MQKKMKLISGIITSIAFVFLGFYLLNNKVEDSNYPILIRIIAYANIIFMGFWVIIGILGLFGNTSILEKLRLKK